MERSNAAILAIFLVVVIACVPLSAAARSPGLTTASAPADASGVVCRTNADCEEVICPQIGIGCSASCVRGECTCKVCAPDVPPQAESTGLAPAVQCPPSECSKFLSCFEGCPKLVHDRCECLETNAF